MHGIDGNTWSDDQNQLIAAIRTYSPQSLIFVEDTGTAFESIARAPCRTWRGPTWCGTSTCTTVRSAVARNPLSPRYANWPQNFDPLVSYAQHRATPSRSRNGAAATTAIPTTPTSRSTPRRTPWRWRISTAAT